MRVKRPKNTCFRLHDQSHFLPSTLVFINILEKINIFFVNELIKNQSNVKLNVKLSVTSQ